MTAKQKSFLFWPSIMSSYSGRASCHPHKSHSQPPPAPPTPFWKALSTVLLNRVAVAVAAHYRFAWLSNLPFTAAFPPKNDDVNKIWHFLSLPFHVIVMLIFHFSASFGTSLSCFWQTSFTFQSNTQSAFPALCKVLWCLRKMHNLPSLEGRPHCVNLWFSVPFFW